MSTPHTTQTIEAALGNVLSEIAKAAGRQDLSAVERLTKRATELRMLSGELAQLFKRIDSILTSTDGAASNGTNSTLRRLPVQVTGGMIRQRLLALTEHVQHKRIEVGETLVIQAQPTGEKFSTVLLENSYKLQERGAVGRFYDSAKIQDGDVIVLIENSPGQWTLQKAPPGEWDGHFRYKRVAPVGS